MKMLPPGALSKDEILAAPDFMIAAKIDANGKGIGIYGEQRPVQLIDLVNLASSMIAAIRDAVADGARDADSCPDCLLMICEAFARSKTNDPDVLRWILLQSEPTSMHHPNGRQGDPQ